MKPEALGYAHNRYVFGTGSSKILCEASCISQMLEALGEEDASDIYLHDELIRKSEKAGLFPLDKLLGGFPEDEIPPILSIKPGETIEAAINRQIESKNADTSSKRHVQSLLWEISRTPHLSSTEKNRKYAEAVILWLHKRGNFYHEEGRDFKSTLYFDKINKILLSICSDRFKAWLSDSVCLNRAERSFAFIQSAAETEGLSERSELILPEKYWAQRPGTYYISCGPGKMCKITAGKYSLVDNGTDGVLFPTYATLPDWSLVAPRDPFEYCSVFGNMSTKANHGELLFKLWMYTLPTDQRTKPVLVAIGDPGSGKTRVLVGVIDLFGLPSRISAVLKNGESDFWTNLDAGGLAVFDNVDTRIDWVPDALAAASTGGSHTKRKLYTDSEQTTQHAKANAAVTSVNPTFASDPALSDRSLVVRLNRRNGGTAESVLTDEVKENRNACLSHIAMILSKVLADNKPVPGGLNKRHPDFAEVAVKIGRALGREQEAISALRAAEADKSVFNLENDSIGSVLMEVLNKESYYGRAADLLEKIYTVDEGLRGKLSAKRLGKRLKKLMPHLEAVYNATAEIGHGGYTYYSFQSDNVAGVSKSTAPAYEEPHEADSW